MRPWIVAEIGSAHGGELSLAMELIVAAADAGADCAKFQIVFADEIIHPATGMVELPGGATALYDRFRALERPADFYAQLREQCRACKIGFLCSVFGLRSLQLLDDLGEQCLKIASPELNHTHLLAKIAGHHTGSAIFLSSGVSTLADIERALEIVGRRHTTLLHCITAYPAPADQYNLRLIATLRAIFGVPTGLSDHSRDPLLVPGLAYTQGATTIEKHFCLSHSGRGLDDPIALDPGQFRQMSRMLGQPPDAVLAELADRYGARTLEATLGDGVKRLAEAERNHYGSTNRSLLALRDIAAGERLDPHNCALLRSEGLPQGMSPWLWREFKAAIVRRAVVAGEGIQLMDVKAIEIRSPDER